MSKKKSEDVEDRTIFTKQDVKAFMRMHDLKVEELAELMGVTDQAVRFWLTGERGVPETTKRVFKLFGKYPDLMREF